jgi:hypothetical protein
MSKFGPAACMTGGLSHSNGSLSQIVRLSLMAHQKPADETKNRAIPPALAARLNDFDSTKRHCSICCAKPISAVQKPSPLMRTGRGKVSAL